MADAKLTALSQIGALDLTDLTYVVDDPGGTPASRKATFAQVAELLGLYRAVLDISTAELAELWSTPLEVVPAPGTGIVIVPLVGWFQLLFGTEPFAQASPVYLVWQGNDAALSFGGVGFDDATSQFFLGVPSQTFSQAQVEDRPLRLYAVDDPGFSGSIFTSSIETAGTGYLVNDTITLTNSLGGTAAVVRVDSIGGGGEVLTYTVTNAGTRYGEASVAGQDSTSGTGVDCELRVDTITPLSDGVARVEVFFRLVELRT